MKILLSKSQWEKAGRKAGWMDPVTEHEERMKALRTERNTQPVAEDIRKSLGISPHSKTRLMAQDHDYCPICGEKYKSQCRCGGPVLPHHPEHLRKGHGRKCGNGHSWSGNLVYDEATDTVSSRLPEKWVSYLSEFPETGMSYQHILITFADDTKMDTHVSNCQYVKDLMPEELGGKAIKDIQVSHR